MDDVAKRFTDTEKWKDDWFLRLKPVDKIFWLYICDNCDHAGIWKVSSHLAGIMIGQDVDLELALLGFGPKVQKLSDDYWFIPNFIRFQYGLLDESNKVHKSVLAILKSKGLEAPTKPHASPLLGAKDKDKEKDKDKDQNQDPNIPDFDRFYAAYPNKKAKQDALKAWGQAKPPIEQVLAALAWQRKQEDWKKDGGAFVPYPATWLRGRRWEDEMPGWAHREHAPAQQAHVHKFDGADYLAENEENGTVLVNCVLPKCQHREWRKK